MFELGTLAHCTMSRECQRKAPQQLCCQVDGGLRQPVILKREKEIFLTQPFLLDMLKPPFICVPGSLPRNT